MTRLGYILAASHSGSTLLSMLLNAHPDVCTVGELKLTNLGDIDQYRCSCGVLIRTCPFWQRLREAMAARDLLFDLAAPGTYVRTGGTWYTQRLLAPLCRGGLAESFRDALLWLSPAWHRHFLRTQQMNAALVEEVSALSGAQVVIDSSKVALRLKYLLRNPVLDVRVIRVIRDGRAVALTYTDGYRFADAADPARRGGGTGRRPAHDRVPVAQAAYQWRRCNEEAESIVRRLPPSQWSEVRYEDLCRSPKATLERVFGFLGVEPSKATQDFRAVEHHVVGNGMRLDNTAEIRLDERWRSVLTEQDLRVFDDVAGDLNRRYGYV